MNQDLKMSLDDVGIVALGSNLPGEYRSSFALLDAAVARLPDAGFRISRLSRWWQAAAWPNRDDPDYLNGVALVETTLTPLQALTRLLALEGEFGRVRGRPNAPRTLDLDLIALGRLVINEEGLILPHPRAHLRGFVMGPLAEVAAGWVHPILGRTASVLARDAPIGRDSDLNARLPNVGSHSK